MSIKSTNFIDYVSLNLPRQAIKNFVFTKVLAEAEAAHKVAIANKFESAIQSDDIHVAQAAWKEFYEYIAKKNSLDSREQYNLMVLVESWVMKAVEHIFGVDSDTALFITKDMRFGSTLNGDRFRFLVRNFQDALLHNEYGFFSQKMIEGIAYELEQILTKYQPIAEAVRYGSYVRYRKECGYEY